MWYVVEIILMKDNPANTQRNKRVTITSKRHFDVIIMCLLRRVFAEKEDGEPCIRKLH